MLDEIVALCLVLRHQAFGYLQCFFQIAFVFGTLDFDLIYPHLQFRRIIHSRLILTKRGDSFVELADKFIRFGRYDVRVEGTSVRV